MSSASVSDVRSAARALQALDPPVVALRCGHLLHIACAEEVVRGAEGRHIRCPLCREPVSTTGAACARLFN